MQLLKVLNNQILLEKFDKVRKTNNTPFADIVSNDNLGIVAYSGHPECSVGTKAYYGPDFEKLTIEGQEYFAMKFENLIAVVQEDNNVNGKQK